MVNNKVAQLDEVLDEVQRFGGVWFKNFLIQGLKVGKMLKVSHMTIIICDLVFDFLLI